MFNLLAGAFTGFMALFGGVFGHHATSTDMAYGHMGSTTPEWMASSTDRVGHEGMGMGTSTENRFGPMGGVTGKVTSITGTTFTVSGHNGMNSATTTFSVDASGAKVFKNQATSTVSAIAVGDMIVVQGPVSGTNVTAKMIFDGVIKRVMDMRKDFEQGGRPPEGPHR